MSPEKLSKTKAKGDKVSKKKDQSPIVTEPVLPEKEVVATKSSVLKRLKKMAYISHEKSTCFSPKLHYKPQVT